MNGYLGTLNPLDGADGAADGVYKEGGKAHSIVSSMSGFKSRGPSEIWVFLDEHKGTLNDGFFRVFMEFEGAQARMGDLPGWYHNGANGFSFADGHAEIHKWRDPRTRVPFNKDEQQTFSVPSPNNQDIAWMQSRTAERVQ